MGDYVVAWHESVTDFLADLDTKLAAQVTQFQGISTTLHAYVDQTVQDIITAAINITVSDAAIAAVLNTSGSTSRVFLDARYSLASAMSSYITMIDAGRLSAATLASSFAAASVADIIATGRLSATSLDAAYALKSTEAIVLTGRLTQANLDSLYTPLALTTSGRLSAATLAATFRPKSRLVADVVALNALVFGTDYGNGAVYHVDDMNADFEYQDTKFVQITTATFATTTARGLAYAKASNAYLVAGARSRITTLTYDHIYWGTTATWVAAGGLIPIKPTAVVGTGVTINQDGSVSFAAVAAGALNGVFTTDFDQYFIKLDMYGNGAAIPIYARLGTAGTIDSGAAYYQAGYSSTSAGVVGAWSASGVAQFDLGRCGSGLGNTLLSKIDIADPMDATRRTAIDYKSEGTDGTNEIQVVAGGRNGTFVAHDGIQFLAQTGAITGKVSVFGHGR
jgi:hypothetical protein